MNHSDNGQSIQEERERRKRITKIKRMIIIVVIAAILFPTVLSIYLIIKVAYLEKKVDGFLAAKEMEYAGVSSVEMEERLMGTVMDLSNAQSATISAPSIMEQEDEKEEGIDWPKKVYLTFDDGPSRYTGQILDTLNKYGVKATFFVVGTENENRLEDYRRIVEEGHTLGMHSYSHKYEELYESEESFVKDLEKLRDFLYETTGVWTNYYRFPGGSSNKVSQVDLQNCISYLHENGMEYFDWNITAKDDTGIRISKDMVVFNVLHNIHRYEEAMILMHDAGTKKMVADALPQIIEALLEQGAEILPIDENTLPIHHVEQKIVEQ